MAMLNWVVVGVGDIARRRVIPAIFAEPRSRIRAVVTRHPERTAEFAPKAYTDLGEALDDPRIDAVYIATPVYLHGPQTLAALNAGKHVLCEKPAAMNYAEAQSMRHAAMAASKLLGIAYYRRFFPKVLRARDLIAAGALGMPLLAEARTHSWAPETEREWLTKRATAGGGPLYDIASHRIDVLNFLFGPPERATALLSNVVHKFEVEDSATLLIDYRSGARGIVDASWNSHIVRDECRILGSDGEIDLTPLSGPEFRGPDGQTESLPAHANVHFPLIENFVSAVLDGVPLVSSIDTALETSWATEEAVASNALSTAATRNRALSSK